MPKGFHPNHPRASHHGRWNRGRIVSSHGYVRVRVGKAHPLADPHGYAYEHLLVWVAAGNPRLKDSEVMQWRNGDRLDNRIENLYVITRAERERRKNAVALRDPRGRLLSNAVVRALERGATLRQHFMRTEG